ncbi:MAG TPA: histidine phosphatase family protein [Caulobacteraceae bacterium]|nr:histidine phosphatase family protein [Caulobacteraceae bacterium]
MTTLILVRHAQSAPRPDLAEAAFPLSEKGRQQARDLAPILAELGVDALASSPYQRAIDTLRPYADGAGLTIAIDHDLRERRLGPWLDDPEAVHEAMRRMHADADFALDGGESSRACQARFEAALARILAVHAGRTIAIGSHGGIISHFLASRADDLPSEFWRRIQNPHLFIFDAGASLRWVGERTLVGPKLR